MKKFLGFGILTAIFVTIFVSQPYNLNYATLPYDWDTVSRGKPSYLASNDSSLQIPLNQLVDSTQQLRDIFSGYLTDLVLTTQQSFIVQLDEDASGTESFIVLTDGGDTLFKISEDSTGYINIDTVNATSLTVSGTITSDSLSVSGATINQNGTIKADTINIGSSTALTDFSYGSSNNVYFSNSTINAEGNLTTDAGLMWLNYHGYNNGTTYFRDLYIGDGKENAIVSVDGSGADVVVNGSLDADTLNVSGSANVGGNLGVGITTPQAPLHVYQGSSGSSAGTDADDFIVEGSGTTGISVMGGASNTSNMFLGSTLGSMAGFSYNNSTDLLSIFTDGAARVYIDNTGMFGIGTNPNYILHTSNSNGSVQFEDTNGAETVIIYNSNPSMSPPETVGEIAFNAKNTIGSPETYALISCVAEDNTSSSEDGYITFETRTSGSRTEKVRISSDGDIGIGTTSPDGKLHVHSGSAGTVTSASDLTIEGISTSYLQFLTSNTGSQRIQFGDPDALDVAYIQYDHNVNQTDFVSGGSTVLTFGSDQSATFSGEAAFNGNYITLPEKATTGDPTCSDSPCFYVNETDNTLRIYTDGTWRTVFSW